jgi:hypothetical protein
MRTVMTGVTYQVSDMQRNHRNMVDQARKSGALIRDKDGLTLILLRAGVVMRDQYLNALMADVMRMSIAVRVPGASRSASQYGSLAWAAVLTEEDQKLFLDALITQLLVSQHSGSTEELEDLLGDWQATALAWADEDLRETLLEEIDRPLTDTAL